MWIKRFMQCSMDERTLKFFVERNCLNFLLSCCLYIASFSQLFRASWLRLLPRFFSWFRVFSSARRKQPQKISYFLQKPLLKKLLQFRLVFLKSIFFKTDEEYGFCTLHDRWTFWTYNTIADSKTSSKDLIWKSQITIINDLLKKIHESSLHLCFICVCAIVIVTFPILLV